jgi:sulfite exporter TauE/SafE/copper chaperone CopZ
MAKQAYYVKGMHCASCEVLIEEKIREIEGVDFANASIATGKLEIDYKKGKPTVSRLNNLFENDGYKFSEDPFANNGGPKNLFAALVIAIFAIGIFLALPNLGLASFINIGAQSSLAAFFVFGLIAGVSSCAALVGGLVLSLAKQWNESYGDSTAFSKRTIPHLMFNFGRIISFAILGGLLGLLGAQVKISQTMSSILVLGISAVMVILAMQMLGMTWFNRIRIALPKSLSTKITDGKKSGGMLAPFIIGFMTFLLPCGFTLATEGLAVLSGNALKGSLIMVSFVLGTTIPLLAIGLSSAKLIANPKTSDKFLKAAGILIIFFVIYNLNFQFGITKYFDQSSPAAAKTATENQNRNTEKQIADNQNVQIIKAIYTESNDIQPSQFTVKIGQPVRLEIDVKDDGYGCMSTIMIPGLWDNPQPLRKGQTIIIEFTPQKSGTFKITCAMGVPRGAITVIN